MHPRRMSSARAVASATEGLVPIIPKTAPVAARCDNCEAMSDDVLPSDLYDLGWRFASLPSSDPELKGIVLCRACSRAVLDALKCREAKRCGG